MAYELCTLKINNDCNELVTFTNRNVRNLFLLIELRENRMRSSCNLNVKPGLFCRCVDKLHCCVLDQIDKPVFFAIIL